MASLRRYRLRRPRSRKSRWVALLVAFGVVAAGGVAAVADPGTITAAEARAQLSRAAFPTDYDPKDMIVAAPTSVIYGTMTETPGTVEDETPTKRISEVNRWRPNTQAWLDAKARLANTSGLTSDDIANTGRWQPKVLTGLKLLGGTASLLAGDSLVTFISREGMLYPALQQFANVDTDEAREAVANQYCMRHGNVVTDWMGSFTGSNCADWREDQAFDDLTAANGMIGVARCHAGACITVTKVQLQATWRASQGLQVFPINQRTYNSCSIRTGTLPNGASFVILGTWSPTYERAFGGGGGLGVTFCSSTEGSAEAPTAGHTLTGTRIAVDGLPGGRLELGNAFQEESDLVEWLTRVRCLDGGTRSSVSAPFTQGAGNTASAPGAISLGNCQPVGVDIAAQRAGMGTGGAGGGWSSVPGGERVQTGTGEVPEVVQDWMTNHPTCWDGSCKLILKRVGVGEELDCFDFPELCLEWSTEVKTQPSLYKCYYGGVLQAIEECAVYSRVFDKVDIRTGYAYPKNEKLVPRLDNKPKTPGNPGPGPRPPGEPEGNPGTSDACWPTGWAAINPLEWVLQPVKCALKWAFVPRQAKLTQTQTAMKLRLDTSFVGEVEATVNNWKGQVTAVGGTGCTGPTLSLNLMGIEYSGSPLSACAEPASTLAFWSRIFIGAGVIIAALFAISRYIGGVFGFTGFGKSSGGES